MIFLITLVCVIPLAFILKEPLKKVPWLFYLLGAILVALFIWRGALPFPVYIERIVYYLVQKCTLAQALFVVVMFIGVFSEKSRIRTYLMPVRAELSILACIIALGHIINFFLTLLPQVAGAGLSLRIPVLVSFFLAILLVALLVVLGVTSLYSIKRRMNLVNWKKVQWFAYPFFLLIYVHILLFLLPSALLGSSNAVFSVIVYTVIYLAYLTLRITAAVRKGRLRQAEGKNPD